VLVADDSPTIQKRVLGILKGEGFEVETVSNGVAAVKRLAFLRPVVILADVSMPGRDGYEVCDFVKNSAAHAHVPVLLIASDMEPYDESRGAQVRADGKIIKPFDPQDLIYMVERFAAQCEASAATGGTQLMAAPMLGPPEIHRSEEATEPPATAPPAADFSAATEGMAFAEPAAKDEESHPAEALPPEFDVPIEPSASGVEFAPALESTGEFASTEPISATPLANDDSPVFDAPPALSSGDTTSVPEALATSPAAEIPMILDEPVGAGSEPVLIEEPVSSSVVPSPSQPATPTRSFRTPLELLDPEWPGGPVWPRWKDETVPVTPQPEMVAATTLDPQLEPETPAAAAEITAEQPAAPEPLTAPVPPTSLESFSLEEDVSAAQRSFISQQLEASVIEAAPLGDIAPLEDFTKSAAEVVLPLEAEPPAEAAAEVAPALESPTELAAEPVAEVAPPLEAAAEHPAPSASEVAPPLEAEASAEPDLEVRPVEAEVRAEAPAPASPPDLKLISAIVHRVVVRMSPPALSEEAMEEMARRLAYEIAAELSPATTASQT